jgi:hypothetical protein
MSNKVAIGVLCEVINGLLGKDSPNLGLIVRVTKFIGHHEVFGPVWEASNEYGERPEFSEVHRPVPPGHQDYAESWLRPLPPGKAPDAVKSRDLEDTAV